MLFVSQDRRARSEARRPVQAITVADLVFLVVDANLLQVDVARSACRVWDDRKDAFGRPADWRGFDADGHGGSMRCLGAA